MRPPALLALCAGFGERGLLNVVEFLAKHRFQFGARGLEDAREIGAGIPVQLRMFAQRGDDHAQDVVRGDDSTVVHGCQDRGLMVWNRGA